MKNFAGFLFILFVLMGAHVHPAHAASFTVCAIGCDHTTITAAIAAASNGDTITVMDAVHTEQGISVDKSLIIQGQGATNTAVQAAATRDDATDRVFYISNTAVVTIQDMTIQHGKVASGNAVAPSGGGIYNLDGTVTINNSTIFDNLVNFSGGGIYNAAAGTVIINNSTILENDTEYLNTKRGGGIDNRGMMTVNNSTISGNTASQYYGGGIYNYNTGTMEINNSVISNNQTGDGGGVFNIGEMTINNSTLSGNSATFAGGSGAGGIYNSSAMTISNSTISGNSSAAAGGGINNSGTINIGHSIIANNTASTSGPDCTGAALTSQDYNLIENTAGCTINGTTTNNITGQDPALGALADNGGPTFTHALLAGSPAIDQIPTTDPDCNPGMTADQRGAARANGVNSGGSACDMGAFEFGSNFTPTAVTNLQTQTTTPPNTIPLFAILLASLSGAWLWARRRVA